MVRIQFFFIEKIKIGRPEHSLTPQPGKFDNISCLPYPRLPTSLKVDVICVLPQSIYFLKSQRKYYRLVGKIGNEKLLQSPWHLL